MVTVTEQFKTTWLTTLFSGALFIGVAFLIFWNEGQAITTWASYDEFIKSAVSVDVTTGHRHDSSFYQGRVVHVVGPIHIGEPLMQLDYNIQVLSAKLKSRVQVYQWIEEEHGRDVSHDTVVSNTEVTYSYHTEWKDYIVNSNNFYIRSGHHNPTSMPASPVSETMVADEVSIGWVKLGTEIKRKFNDYYEITGDSRPDIPEIRLHSGMYYHGDPLNHQVGDIRVRFSYAGREGNTYTAVGVLEGQSLLAYDSIAGPLVVLKKGSFSIDTIPYEELGTWKYRAACWFQSFAALMTLHPTWMAILLRSRLVSPQLRLKSRLVINVGLASCFTLFFMSFAWIYHGEKRGAFLMMISLLPIIYHSSFYHNGGHTSDEDD